MDLSAPHILPSLNHLPTQMALQPPYALLPILPHLLLFDNEIMLIYKYKGNAKLSDMPP